MTLGELWRRMLHLVRGSRASDELREEMQLHVESARRDLVSGSFQCHGIDSLCY